MGRGSRGWGKGGGASPGRGRPRGRGGRALNVRYGTGRGRIGENDQITFEMGDAWRHYHATDMFTVLTGPKVDDRHLRMFDAAAAALGAVQDALRPGRTLGEIFEVHQKTLDQHSYGHAALKACGYTLGATFPPTWMEMPMIYRGNPLPLEVNMVFFTHMILSDFDTGPTMSLGETALVTAGAPEVITHGPRGPIVRN